MGRPATKPKKLKDGFYLEIRNKGSKTGVKLYRDTRAQMMRTIKEYEHAKEILILGESKNGKWVDKEPKVHVVEE
ncbi:MAG: hypothetical protein R3213_01760 [Flavobacteriaceae bacterium]|nr:hypothetical protein [Flavobacteriaceae bacterium]